MEPDEGAAAAVDPAALIEQHLPLVRRLAAKFYRLRWDDSVRFEEFCQMGSVGLVEAAQRYDPTRGAQFATFATWRITGSILNGLACSTERHQQISARKRLLQERAASWSAGEEPAGDPLEAALARLSEAAIGLAIGFMLEGTGMYSDGAEVTRSDGYRQLATGQLMQRLRASVQSLAPSEKTVIEGHYFQQRSFVDLAAQLGLTKGRISQIHRAAVEKLRAALREHMIGFDG